MKRVFFTFVLLLSILGAQTQTAAIVEAEQLYQQGDYEASSIVLLMFIENNPQRKHDVGQAWHMHSSNLLARGLATDAWGANEKSLKLRMRMRSDEVTENYLRQAEIYLYNENPLAAIDACYQGMDMLIEDPELYANLNKVAAKAFHEIKAYEEARSYMGIAAEIIAVEMGENTKVYADLMYEGGVLLIKQSAYEEALTYLTQAFYSHSATKLRIRDLIWIRYASQKRESL